MGRKKNACSCLQKHKDLLNMQDLYFYPYCIFANILIFHLIALKCMKEQTAHPNTKLDGVALLVTIHPPPNSTGHLSIIEHTSDTHQINCGQPYFWLYTQHKEHPQLETYFFGRLT